MTTTINAALLKSHVHDSTISNSDAENIIDQAINELILYGADLSNLSGTSESKFNYYTSNQAGAIMSVARVVYSASYRTSGASSSSRSIGSMAKSDSLSGSGQADISNAAMIAARFLISRSIVRA